MYDRIVKYKGITQNGWTNQHVYQIEITDVTVDTLTQSREYIIHAYKDYTHNSTCDIYMKIKSPLELRRKFINVRSKYDERN